MYAQFYDSTFAPMYERMYSSMTLLGYSTDDLPKFHYWLFGTITGFTGVLATLVVFVMYVFAQQYARRATFRGFWLTHHLYIILYILMFMHGAGRLVQVRQARGAALGHIAA